MVNLKAARTATGPTQTGADGVAGNLQVLEASVSEHQGKKKMGGNVNLPDRQLVHSSTPVCGGRGREGGTCRVASSCWLVNWAWQTSPRAREGGWEGGEKASSQQGGEVASSQPLVGWLVGCGSPRWVQGREGGREGVLSSR